MRTLSTAISLCALLLWGAAGEAVEPYVELGIGVPELGRVQGGVYIIDDLSVDLLANTVVFNYLVGVGATGYLFRTLPRPETHSMALRGSVLLNPFADPVRIAGGGETIASAIATHVGYAYDAGTGFLVRVLLGGFHFIDGDEYGFGFGVSLGVGWRFGPRRF